MTLAEMVHAVLSADVPSGQGGVGAEKPAPMATSPGFSVFNVAFCGSPGKMPHPRQGLRRIAPLQATRSTNSMLPWC
jgi:hypothetical protein